MNWFKRDPLLATLICSAFVSISGEGWWLWRARAEAVRALSLLEQKNREREGLREQSPAPTEENELIVKREITSAQTRLADLEKALSTGGRAEGVAAIKPTDAYFEIASFVEKARALAAQSHVSIRPDEHFGFASHASEGPGFDALRDVLRQRAAAQVLVEALLAAQPASLISVQREHPLTSAPRAGRGDPTDFFEPASGVSLRKPGMLEVDAFKVEFTGQTRVLREFVNRLLSADRTFAVRVVEAESVSPVAANPGSAGKSAMVLPVVVEGISRFRVVVERLRPAVGTEKEVQ